MHKRVSERRKQWTGNHALRAQERAICRMTSLVRCEGEKVVFGSRRPEVPKEAVSLDWRAVPSGVALLGLWLSSGRL